MTRVLAARVGRPRSPRGGHEENPYKKAKVGEYATYKMTTKVVGQASTGPSRRRSRPRTTRRPRSR